MCASVFVSQSQSVTVSIEYYTTQRTSNTHTAERELTNRLAAAIAASEHHNNNGNHIKSSIDVYISFVSVYVQCSCVWYAKQSASSTCVFVVYRRRSLGFTCAAMRRVLVHFAPFKHSLSKFTNWFDIRQFIVCDRWSTHAEFRSHVCNSSLCTCVCECWETTAVPPPTITTTTTATATKNKPEKKTRPTATDLHKATFRLRNKCATLFFFRSWT